MNPNIPMKPELILVIEDDAAILFGLRDNLQRAGYGVRSAGDGHQGLELARTLRPDLVLAWQAAPVRSLLPWLERHGIDVSRSPWFNRGHVRLTAPDEATLRRIWETEETIKGVARQLGVSFNTAAVWLAVFGGVRAGRRVCRWRARCRLWREVAPDHTG